MQTEAPETKVILVTAQKGGVGKSTLSFLIAKFLSENFKVGIVDLDNQGSFIGNKERIEKLMASIEQKIKSIDEVARTKEHFDYQIRPESAQSKVIVKLKNELRKLGDEMVYVAKANKIDLSTDDVTDPEETKI